MATVKYVKVGEAWKLVTTEYVNIGGDWKLVTSNYVNIGGDWKPVPIGEKYIWSGEQDADNLYGIDDNQNVLAGWPKTGGTIANPADVACDDDGNSYWACSDNLYKFNLAGTQVWKYTGFTSAVVSVCVDVDGNVYAGSAQGNVRKINSAGGLVWSKTPHVGAVNALAVDYSEGQVYGAYGVNGDGRIYRFLVVNGNGSNVYLNSGAHCYSIAIDEGTPSLYIGDENGWLRKISTTGFVSWSTSKGGELYAVRIGHDGYGYYVNGSRGDVGKFTLSNGADVWRDQPAGTSRGLAVDAFGNVYSCHGPFGGTNAVIRKNNSGGVEQWTWQPYVNSEWRGVAVSPGIKAAGF